MEPSKNKSAFPKMLPDRSWGASVDGVPAVGERITITTRGGKVWDSTVTAIVATVDGRTEVAVQSDPRPAQHSAPRGRSRSSHARIGGRDWFVNSRGRCEDAPCCGCCS